MGPAPNKDQLPPTEKLNATENMMVALACLALTAFSLVGMANQIVELAKLAFGL